MDTKSLIRFLKNDLIELTDILGEIQPGRSLSGIEIKLIKSRVRSLTEEFEMLELNVDSNSETLLKKADDADSISEKLKKDVVASDENIENIVVDEPLEFTEEVEQDDVAQKMQNEIPEVERLMQSPNDLQAESQTVEQPVSEEPHETPVPEEPQEVIEQQAANEMDVIAEDLDEPVRWQTIAEKYNGSSDSLNDRMAAHIAQQDLASKLQQNPIDDLNKAIKLNDKVWFIKELFGGNADVYKEAINTINRMNDMDEALVFLESNYTFEQDKKSFKSFIEFIYRRFLK